MQIWIAGLDSYKSRRTPTCCLASVVAFTRSRSSKVIEFGANRKPVYDFLLVINSNLGLISHRYRDTATYWSKIANFAYPPLIERPRSGWLPSNLWKSFTVPETRVGKDLVILACTVFDWSTRVTDGWTDRRTDIIAMAKARWKQSCFRA